MMSAEAEISADELEQLLQSVARGELQVPIERRVSVKTGTGNAGAEQSRWLTRQNRVEY